MPHEVRRLVFNLPEVTEAVQLYSQHMQLKLPAGRITRVVQGSASDYEANAMKNQPMPLQGEYNVQNKRVAVILTFFDDKTYENKYINVTSDFLASALIAYCVESRVMLPKSGGKTLEIGELTVSIEIKYHAATKESGTSLSIED